MSNRSSAGATSVPATPVKGQQLLQRDPGLSKATSISLASPKPISVPPSRSPKLLHNVRGATAAVQRAQTLGLSSPQVSERDSIFADNYVTTINGQISPVMETATLPPSGSRSPASRVSLTAAITDPAPNSSNIVPSVPLKIAEWFRQLDAGSEKKPDTRARPSAGVLKSIRRISSDGYNSGNRIQVSMGASKGDSMNTRQDQEYQTKVQDDNYSPRSNTPMADKASQPNMVERGSSLKQALQERRPERSVSRGRSHVDKSIEATVKRPEAGGAARSRKASHMMGIFDSRVDVDDQVKSGETSAITSNPASPVIEGGKSSFGLIRTGSSNEHAFAESLSSSPKTYQLDTEVKPKTDVPSKDSKAVSPLRPVHDPYFRSQDILSMPKAPVHLLEEIRSAYHERKKQTQRSAPPSPQPNALEELVDAIDSSESTKHDEDEEHISAAIYYPHPGPSVEEIEQFINPTDAKEVEKTLPAFPELVTTVRRASRSSDEGRTTEHIDISVVSKHDKKIFHGNYQPTEEVTVEEDVSTPKVLPVDDVSDARVTSASESEFESGDEFGQFDLNEDLARTPTQQRREMRKRASTSTKPKTKVVLEPYKHQVGGHSTMFRFSKRAVCKQLNNRENEFYERIEQRHPDMLKFLPRYIGVLNVTFSKTPKQTRINDKQNTETDVSRVAGANDHTDRSAPLQNGTNEMLAPVQSHGSNHPRIVSHSQRTDTVPEVIIAQNKHLIPSDYFELPERPRSVDPNHGRRTNSEMNLSAASRIDNSGSGIPPGTRTPDHIPGRGKTSVNSQLKEKVLRDVFGPPLIQYQRHHSSHHGTHHSTLPRMKEPVYRRKSNLSVQTISSNDRERLRDSSARRDEIPHRQHSQVESESNYVVGNGHDQYSPSASIFDDVKNGLERIRTTGSTNSNDSHHEQAQHHLHHPKPHVRRRHSGMSLRRRRKSINERQKPDLEYIENEAFSEEIDEEVFSMDDSIPKSIPSLREKDETVSGPGNKAQAKPDEQVDDDNGTVTPVPEPNNNRSESQQTKEAQNNPANDRVAYFLLLEDLTSGMGRPCVLDLKMGTRQYGVEASKKKKESQQRKCKTTTSQQLGVRICGMQSYDKKMHKSRYEDKYFGRDLKAGREFREALTRFLHDGISNQSVARHIPTILHKISKLESMVRRLPGYRFYASSLLVLYDAEPEKSREATDAAKNGVDIAKQKKREGKPWPPPIDLKIVDFANCITGEDDLPDGAQAPPAHPDDVDRGYLRGLRTLKMYFEHILNDIKQKEVLLRDTAEVIHEEKEHESLRGSPPSNGTHERPVNDEGEVSV